MNKFALQQKYIHAQGELERIAYLLNRAKELDLSDFQSYIDLSSEALRRLETLTCSMRRLFMDTTFTPKSELMAQTAHVQGILIKRDQQWYHIVIPALIPKRRQNCDFIIEPLRYALSEYVRANKPERLRECILCFQHVYSQEIPAGWVRDHDNMEVKKVQDVIADQLMTDDSGRYCSNLSVSALGDKDCTEIYLMRPEMLPEWLKNHPIYNVCFDTLHA